MNGAQVRDLLYVEDAAPRVRRAAERPGDQRWYVSDTGRFRAATGWEPGVSMERGLERLHAWLAPPVRRAAAVPA
jgi:CDP-paratose 2-epimerase